MQLSALSAPTLGDAVARVARLIPLFNDSVEIAVTRDGTSLTFAHRIAGVPEGLSRHGNDAMLVAFLERARDATGCDVTPRECWLAHPRPTTTVELERAVRAERMSFGAGESGVRLDATLADRPLRSADPVLLAVLDRLSEQSLAMILLTVVPRAAVGYGEYHVRATTGDDAAFRASALFARDVLGPWALVVEVELSVGIGF